MSETNALPVPRATRKGGAPSTRAVLGAIFLLALLATAVGCAPKVAIEAPTEPIVINMNIKVEHEIKMSVEEDLDKMLEEDEELF